MAKVTLTPYGPDDPIFKSGPQVFVPASRPSTESLQPSTAGTEPPTPEQEEQSAMADQVAKARAILRSKSNSTS